jgi:hypothetical protein
MLFRKNVLAYSCATREFYNNECRNIVIEWENYERTVHGQKIQVNATMEQHTLNNCLNSNIYSYLETSVANFTKLFSA